MPITYPLVIPGTIGQARANLKKFDAIGQHIGPFDGSSQEQQWQDQHWELDLEWPEMTWPQFAALDAFSGALHGRLGSFLWGPPLATGPRGLGNLAGAPICANPAASSTIVDIGVFNFTAGQIFPGSVAGNYLEVSLPPGGAANFILGEILTPSGFTAHPEMNGLRLPLVLIAYLGIPGGTELGLVLGPLVQPSPTFAAVAETGLVSVPPYNVPRSGLLYTAGWLPNQNGILLPGDFLQLTALDIVNNVLRQRLHQYIGSAPLNSNGGGNALLDIFPFLRETPGSATVVLLNPQGTFRLTENLRDAPAARTKTFSFQTKCREAI